MTRQDVLELLEEQRLIAILRADFKGWEIDLARALINGGIRILEVSTVSPNFGFVIQNLVKEFGHCTAIGAGTVLTHEHLSIASDAGASFIISPNTNRSIISGARERHLVTFPGAYTPTEVLQAVDYGADAVKLFPADSLGPGYVRAIRGPLPSVRLIPTGGINPGNIAAYFEAGAWAVAAGSELVKRNEADLHDWPSLRRRAEEFASLSRRRQS